MKISSNTKTKKSLITSVFIITTLLLFFFMSSMIVSKEKTLATFKEALLNNDAEKLQPLLTSEDPNLKITIENVERFIDYFDTYNKDKIEMLDTLVKENNHELIKVKKIKKWVFFDDYTFSIKPLYIAFDIDKYVNEIEIVGEEKIVTHGKDSVRSGPLVPGYYEMIVKHEADYQMKYSKNTSINVIPLLASDDYVIPHKTRTKSIEVMSNVYGGTLYINDRRVNIDISNKPTKLFAIPHDGSISMYIEKEYPWGTFQSDKVVVQERIVALVIWPVNESLTNEIREVAEKFASSWKDAFNNNDSSLIKNSSPFIVMKLQEKKHELRKDGIQKITSIDVDANLSSGDYILGEHEIIKYELPQQEEHYGASIIITETYDNGLVNRTDYRFIYNEVNAGWTIFDYNYVWGY